MGMSSSGGQSGGVWRRTAVEVVLVAVLFAGGATLGRAWLDALRSDNGLTVINAPDELFGRSVMMAAGRGSFCPNSLAVPVLRDFVQRRVNTLDAASLPADIPTTHDYVVEYHVYLVWLVALLWRLFGISWLVLEWFLALVLGLCAVFTYGLFRLGMNRVLSLAGTSLYISSPAVLGQLNSLRDFSKAPFLLAGMLAIGWLMTRRKHQRSLPAAVVVMGLIAGIGMGFRQDKIILMPATLAAILFFSPGVLYGTLRRRMAMAFLYLAVFLMAAWPMLTRMEGGAQPFQPLAQGYSAKHLFRCTLKPGVCEPLACSQDGFVYDTVLGYARRATGNDRLSFGFDSPAAARFTRDWVVATALQFPADTLARVYGSTTNVLSGAESYMASLREYQAPMMEWIAEIHRRAAVFRRATGLFFAVAALLAVAAINMRLGLGLFFFCLYFSGYVSLDNEWRHTFHLSYLSFWTIGTVLQCAWMAAVRTRARTSRWGAWTCRAAITAVVVTLGLGLPWQATRVWQRHTVGLALQCYAAAPKTQVATTSRALRDWTLFTPEKDGAGGALQTADSAVVSLQNGPSSDGSISGVCSESRCTLYAAHFSAKKNGRTFMTKYHDETMPNDFTQLLGTVEGPDSSGDVWFFFPAYTGPLEKFEGIAVPEECAGDLLGLYRVNEKGLPALLPCATLQDKRADERLCADVEIPYDPVDMQTPETDAGHWLESAQLEERLGDLNDAVIYLRAFDAFEPSRQTLEKKIELYHRLGNAAQSLDALKSLVISQGDCRACDDLDRHLVEHMTPEQRQHVWESVAAMAGDSGQAWLHYGRALSATCPGKAVEPLRKAATRLPGDRIAIMALHETLFHVGQQAEKEGNIVAAVDALQEAIRVEPDDPMSCWEFSSLLSRGEPDAARTAWDKLKRETPENALIAVLCGAAHVADHDHSGAREALRSALQFGAGDWNVCAAAGNAYADMGEWSDAVAAFEQARALNPRLEPQRLLIATGCRNEQAGDVPGAILAYTQAILKDPANSEPYWRLEAAYPRGHQDNMLGLWREIQANVPENAVADVLCGESLAAAGIPGAARAMLDAALRLGMDDYNVLVHAGDAYSFMADWTQAETCYVRALAKNPGLEYVHPRLDDARKRAANAGATTASGSVSPA